MCEKLFSYSQGFCCGRNNFSCQRQACFVPNTSLKFTGLFSQFPYNLFTSYGEIYFLISGLKAMEGLVLAGENDSLL